MYMKNVYEKEPWRWKRVRKRREIRERPRGRQIFDWSAPPTGHQRLLNWQKSIEGEEEESRLQYEGRRLICPLGDKNRERERVTEMQTVVTHSWLPRDETRHFKDWLSYEYRASLIDWENGRLTPMMKWKNCVKRYRIIFPGGLKEQSGRNGRATLSIQSTLQNDANTRNQGMQVQHSD